MPCAIKSIPEGFHLQVYDDCGNTEPQSHIRAKGVHEFTEAGVSGDQRLRSATWHEREIVSEYEGLNSTGEDVAAITYANEAFNRRAQSLWSGSVLLHGPHALPKGGAAARN